MDDLETQFNSIVSQLDMHEEFPDVNDKLTLRDINRCIAGMNEASTYLGRFIDQVLKEESAAIPTEVGPLIRQLMQMTDKVSGIMATECACPDCTPEECPLCEEDEHGICDECAEYFNDEEGDDASS